MKTIWILLFCCTVIFTGCSERTVANETAEPIVHQETTKEQERDKPEERTVDATKEHEHNYKDCICTCCGEITDIDEDDHSMILTDYLLNLYGLKGVSVNIPDTVDYNDEEYRIVGIGPGAYYNDTALEDIVLPDTAVYIGENAFNGCTSLKNATLPDGLKHIGKAAFQLCSSLEEIKIPDTVEYIGNFAYNHCISVKNTVVSLPGNLKSIGENIKAPSHTFYDCGNVQRFEISPNNNYYKSDNGILYTKDGQTLVAIPEAMKFKDGVFEMPDTVTNLGELAFGRNQNIETVILSDELEITANQDEIQRAAYVNDGTTLAIGCYGYCSVSRYEVKSSNKLYRAIDGIIYSRDGKELVAIPAQYAGDLVIPEGTETWRKQALWTEVDYFKDIAFNKITSISIPETMSWIHAAEIEEINKMVKYYGTKIVVDPGNKFFKTDQNGCLIVI